MAIVTNNLVLRGLSGMLGKTFVFKTLRGKTIIASRPTPTTRPQSERQRGTRTKFKEATIFAKAAMANPDRKAYYTNKAKKLKLPNAYTAALTDYMRKPAVAWHNHPNTGVVLQVFKKDFELQNVQLLNTTIPSASTEKNVRKSGHTWLLNLGNDHSEIGGVLIEDETGQQSMHPISAQS